MNERQRRLDELLPGGNGVWVAIDHSVSQPQRGLIDIEGLLALLGAADALVAHKGVVRHFAGGRDRFVMHLSASTIHGGAHADDKVLVGSVGEAQRAGAAAVSVQVNLGSEHEAAMLERLGMVATRCSEFEMPLLGMIYPRGRHLNLDSNDATAGVLHCARLGWELGCDVVKVPWTGDPTSFAEVVAAVPIPVLVAGGIAESGPEAVFELITQAISAGARGVCIGRNVFNSAEPAAVLARVVSIVHPSLRVQVVD